MRRIIEVYSTNTRFCLICNYVSKLIDPLTSRCVKFRFQLIGKDSQIGRLKYIAEQENVKIKDERTYDALYKVSEGDMRRSINMLQTAASFKGREIEAEHIFEISGLVPDETIAMVEQVLYNSKQPDYTELSKFCNDQIILEGYDIQ